MRSSSSAAAVPTGAEAADCTVFDPLSDPAWGEWIAAQPGAFFPSAPWISVLQDTYGHRPTFLGLRVTGGSPAVLPLMEVSSSLRGRRGVCLPFTDECGPVPDDPDSARRLFHAAVQLGRERHWRFLEVRGGPALPGAVPALFFRTHRLDLTAGEDTLFTGCSASTRQAVRKARREGVRVEFRQDLPSVRAFYSLHCETRQKHGLPPQPFRFFERIQARVLAPGHGQVVLARLGARPIAGALFLHRGEQAIYKFGASHDAFQHLRPNNLVMWEGIRACAHRGCRVLSFGRTSANNAGLLRFKRGWGAEEALLPYWKFDLRKGTFVTMPDRASGWHTSLFTCLPLWLLRIVGRVLYPHLS